MHVWTSERSHYLDELIQLEGRGKADHSCHACGDLDTSFRCEDCFSVDLFCRLCMIKSHQNLPLHRVKVGSHFGYYQLGVPSSDSTISAMAGRIFSPYDFKTPWPAHPIRRSRWPVLPQSQTRPRGRFCCNRRPWNTRGRARLL